MPPPYLLIGGGVTLSDFYALSPKGLENFNLLSELVAKLALTVLPNDG